MRTVNLIEGIYFAALDKKIPAERIAYLDEACKGDDVLRRCVERMLDAEPKIGDFLQPNGPATIAPPPIEERPGSIIGPYKLLQQLGEGGFGVVFMAEQEKPVRRKIALKIIKPGMDSKQVVARFEAERQALALMDHPNIARVFDGGTTDSGRPYFVMELVKGTPITEFCDKNRLSPRERLELFIPVCQAVQHAHQKGIIHRDIKPSNVLITMYDDKPVPKVIDFGIAKAIAEKLTEQTLFTRVGQVIGTLEYMSPEQASLNALDVDTRADVYALGVLLYELLTGTTPLDKQRMDGVAFMEMLRLIREEEPPKPSTRLSQSGDALTSYALDRRTDRQKLPKLVKGELDWITMKALEKDRSRRYETANALASDVQRYLKDEQVEACPPSISYRLQKYTRKHKTAFAMTSMAASLLLFGIVATGWQALRATSAEDKALANEKTARDERDETAAVNVKLHDANVGLQEAREDMRRTLYFARSNLLQNAWEANNMGQIFQLLDLQRPGPDERDLRDFEWHYRDRLCHQDLLTITGVGGDRPMPIFPAFSPDGKYVVAQVKRAEGVLNQGEFAVYRLADGSERTRLKFEEKRPTSSFSWSSDSQRVLIFQKPSRVPGGFTLGKLYDYDLVVCDAADGHEISRMTRTSQNPFGSTNGLGGFPETVSDNGKYFAIRKGDLAEGADGVDLQKISLGQTATGKIVHTFSGIGWRPQQGVFSPDGRRFAAVIQIAGSPRNSNLTIKVWDVSSGDELLSGKITGNGIIQMHFSPDGNRLSTIALAMPKRSIEYIAWDLINGEQRSAFTLTLHDKENDGRTVISPDGTRLAVYVESEAGAGEVRVHDTATGKAVETIRGVNVAAFQFSPDSKMLAVGGRDGTVHVWNLCDGTEANAGPALVLRGHTSEIGLVKFHSDGSRLFSASLDGTVKVWDISPHEQTANIGGAISFGTPAGLQSHHVAFSETAGRILAVSHRTSPTGGKKADREKALGVTQKSTITVWDLTGKPLASFAGPLPSANFTMANHPIALSTDGRRLAMISFFGSPLKPGGAELHVLETDSGKEVFMHKIGQRIGFNTVIAFSRDGKRIALGFADEARETESAPYVPSPVQVKIFNSADGAEVQRIVASDGYVNSLAFSPDGTGLAVAAGGMTTSNVAIWDVRSGKRGVEFDGIRHEAIYPLVFSDDGTRLAGINQNFRAGAKSDAFVWDATTGKKLFTLPAHSGYFASIAFSPNGRRIATAKGIGKGGPPGYRPGNEVKLWDASTGNELMTLKDLDRNSARYLSFNAAGTRLHAVGVIGNRPEEKIEIRTWDATPRDAK